MHAHLAFYHMQAGLSNLNSLRFRDFRIFILGISESYSVYLSLTFFWPVLGCILKLVSALYLFEHKFYIFLVRVFRLVRVPLSSAAH